MDKRILTYLKGKLSASDQLDLLEEAQTNAALIEDLKNVKKIDSLLILHSKNIDLKEGLRAYQKQADHKPPRKVSLYTAKWVAVAALLMLATWFFTYKIMDSTPLRIPKLGLTVPAGQRASIRLPDGTIVWLNANSTLHYPALFGKERRVFLSGEGFFEVAHNKQKPFIVSTKKMDIQALGTRFNVFSYRRFAEKSVYLEEGSVKVTSHAPLGKPIYLKPGQKVIMHNGTFQFVKNQADAILWKEGVYSFEEQTMTQIKERLELYFDVSIQINNPSILDYTYTGKFKQTEGVMEILRLLQKIYHFQIKNDREKNSVYLY